MQVRRTALARLLVGSLFTSLAQRETLRRHSSCGHKESPIHDAWASDTSCLTLNPLASPGRSLEGICEILCLVHDLTVAELHYAYCVCRSPLVGDCVLRDPEITFSEDSLDFEARRFAWMMTPQGL